MNAYRYTMANPTSGPSTRRCAGPICTKVLPADAGSRRRYCSNACRQQAHRDRSISGGQPAGPQSATRRRAGTEELREKATHAQQVAGEIRRDLLQRFIWPHAHHRGAGPGGYTTTAASLITAAREVLAAAVAADRAAGLSWGQIGAQLGIDATTARRRYAAAIGSGDRDGPAGNAAVRAAALPADTRPLPSVEPYDQLLRHPHAPTPRPRAGRGWDEADVCLWREDGRWGLTGPDGVIEVPEFGLFGNALAAGDTTGAQAAAAAVITALTGRAITGWDQDESSRSVYGPSSWYACLASV